MNPILASPRCAAMQKRTAVISTWVGVRATCDPVPCAAQGQDWKIPYPEDCRFPPYWLVWSLSLRPLALQMPSEISRGPFSIISSFCQKTRRNYD